MAGSRDRHRLIRVMLHQRGWWCGRPYARRVGLLGAVPARRDAEPTVMTPETAFVLRTRLPLLGPAEQPPILRPGTVPRARLVRRLLACRDRPVVIISAPAGYGKTTLLAEWALRDERPFTWLACGDADAALLAIQTAACARVPQVIVLDEAGRVAPGELGRLLNAARDLPPGAVFALGSRAALDEPAG